MFDLTCERSYVIFNLVSCILNFNMFIFLFKLCGGLFMELAKNSDLINCKWGEFYVSMF